MKHIKESSFNAKKWSDNQDQLNDQSNILIDQLIKCRDYINNRIKEVFDYDVNNNSHIDTPNPCNISIYTDENNTDKKATTFDISDDEKLNNYRSWGKFLNNIKGKCEIDFILTYIIYIDSDFRYDKNRDIDQELINYETHSKKLSEIVKKIRIFKEDLGDLKITKLYDIDNSNAKGEYCVMFQLRRKNRVIIDPLKYIKKINNFNFT